MNRAEILNHANQIINGERQEAYGATALKIVREYILEHLDKTDEVPNFNVFMVWKSKVLQNWKYLISSTLWDGMYYELTFNGDANEWYLDAYKKFENKVIKVPVDVREQ